METRNTTYSVDEHNYLLSNLVDHHSIFYKFWKLSIPIYSEEIDTACVSFDQNYRCVNFLINPKFWVKQSIHNKKFIIAHECWHIINQHSRRVQNSITELANQAMDIVVNESLIKYFNFSRKEIDPDNEFCWLDTCFPKEDNIEPWKNFEYYLNKLNSKDSHSNKNLLTSHDGIGSIPKEFISDLIDGVSEDEVEVLRNILNDSEKNSRKDDGDNKIPGRESGGAVKEIFQRKIAPKKKWESVIKKFEKKIRAAESEETHWLYKNRRIVNLDTNLFIPSDIEEATRRTMSQKISTWFFMDTSGSCWNFSDRFFNAAKSLNKDIFDVKYFFFDTKVYNVDIKSNKVFGGGGTSFKAISNYIYSKNITPYVWVLTDGYGDKPAIPDSQKRKWYWFLTEEVSNHSNVNNFIPKESKIYLLKDFE